MKLYEIINPSDPYTMKAPTDDIAAAAVVILGEGWYFLADAEGEAVDLGAMRTDLATFAKPPNRRKAIIAALESVLIGSAADRATFEAVIAEIHDPADRARASAKYHDRKRSSMNDIGAHAAALAAHMRRTTA